MILNLSSVSIVRIAMAKIGRAMFTGKGSCIKRYARSAAKNVKSLSGLQEIARYIAKNVFRSARQAAHLKEITIIGARNRNPPRNALSINIDPASTEGLTRRRSGFRKREKNKTLRGASADERAEKIFTV